MKTKLTSAEANILVGELIGRHVRITNSSDQKMVGIEGIIIDETLNTIKIKTNKGTKTIKKSNNMFDFNGTQIKGEKLVFRPHDRLKKYWRKIK